MAWRDSRGSRMHLVLSVAAIALGIGALFAIRSFGDRMDRAIERETRSLLGADLSIRSLQPFDNDAEKLLAEIPGEQVRETRFFSMVTFPQTGSTRLSQVRALSNPFPFYGRFDTEPPEAAERFLSEPGLAVVEESLMLQFNAGIGDSIRIGAHEFTIAGRLTRVSGEAPATSAFLGPRVYVAARDLPHTELLREGSLARYYAHYQLPQDTRTEPLLQQLQGRMTELRLESETADQRRALTGAALENLYRFLHLGGFIALLLGGIGLAGSIQLYARKKRSDVAVLRCLGASARTAFMVYVVQAAAAAFAGALIGLALGAALQYALPALLSDFLPIFVVAGWSWRGALLSLLYGLGLSVAFALYPLTPLRRVSPLSALRLGRDDARSYRFDPVQGLVLGMLGLMLLIFSMLHTERWTQGLALAAGVATVFALLAAAARLLMWLTRRGLRDGRSFAWRQGIANIHRPYNQTGVLLLSLGLGTFLLASLTFTQDNIVAQFRSADDEGRPNMILFDIQGDQVEPIEALAEEEGLEHIESTPIVTMRLLEVNSRTVTDLRNDRDLDIPDWVLFREYRSTYRERLDERERIIRGQWEGRVDDASGLIPISIDQTLADFLRIGLNARMVFDLQGVRLQTYVRSIRDVDWRQLRTNFFVIFPAGVLESAPQNFAMVIRAPGLEAAAHLQNRVITRFPNVSAIDLRMIVQALDDVLDKAAHVIRFMALFSVLTGLLVLGGTVLTSRYDRMEEAALLRTLGATRGQLNRIMAAEYVLLGAIASIAGILLALLASWLIAWRLFDIAFRPALWPIAIIPPFICGATLLVGLLANRAFSPRPHP